MVRPCAKSGLVFHPAADRGGINGRQAGFFQRNLPGNGIQLHRSRDVLA